MTFFSYIVMLKRTGLCIVPEKMLITNDVGLKFHHMQFNATDRLIYVNKLFLFYITWNIWTHFIK